jgi:hypothetical protein
MSLGTAQIRTLLSSVLLLGVEDMWLTELYSRSEQVKCRRSLLRHFTDWAVLRDNIFSVWKELTLKATTEHGTGKKHTWKFEVHSDTPRITH